MIEWDFSVRWVFRFMCTTSLLDVMNICPLSLQHRLLWIEARKVASSWVYAQLGTSLFGREFASCASHLYRLMGFVTPLPLQARLI